MSPELQLIAAPAATYARLARTPSRIGPITALRRPLLVTLVLGASQALAATRHAPPALLLSTTICWSTVVLLQVAIALVMIAGPARRTVGLPRALDLFFAAHAPWSLWMLAAVAWAPLPGERSVTPLLVAVLFVIGLTARMIVAFFREVLHLESRAALARMVTHQAITWGTFAALFGSAVAIVPRILQWLE